MAGRPSRHKDNHTFDLCESLTVHDSALQHMATWFFLFCFFFTFRENILLHYIRLKNVAYRLLVGCFLRQNVDLTIKKAIQKMLVESCGEFQPAT